MTAGRAARWTATVLTVVALAGPVSADALSTGGSVTLTARARPLVYLSERDPGKLWVKANAPWSVNVDTPEGAVRISGGITAGSEIELPKGYRAYSAALD